MAMDSGVQECSIQQEWRTSAPARALALWSCSALAPQKSLQHRKAQNGRCEREGRFAVARVRYFGIPR